MMSLIGQLLVAMPHSNHPRFHHAVVYVCGHDLSGSMGMVINKPFENMTISHLLTLSHGQKESVSSKYRLYDGGPVESGRGFVLHTDDFFGPESIAIHNNLSITASIDILSALMKEKGPRKALVSLGYTGWTSGQLEREIHDNHWLNVSIPSADYLFNSDNLWERSYGLMGIHPHQMASITGTA